MNLHPFRAPCAVAMAAVLPARPKSVCNRALLAVGLVCFSLVSGCKEKEVVGSRKSQETHGSTTRPDNSKTAHGSHSQESVKDLFLSEKKQRDAAVEQRVQSVDELSAAALVTSIRALNPVGDGNDRVILPDIFLALAKKDPGKVLEMLNEQPGEYYKDALTKAFPYLAKENPRILKNYVLNTDFKGEKDKWMMMRACEFIGRETPGEALVFFDEISEEKKRGALGIVMLKQAASKEPSQVVDFLVNKRASPYFTGIFRDVLYTVMVTDPGYALKVSSSYPEVRDTNLSAGIYASMARQDPKWAIKEMPGAPPEVRLEILTRRNFENQTYFANLFSSDPVGTIGLLNGISVTPANAHLFKDAADQLSSLPAGPVKTSSVRSFAALIRPSDPQTADRWIESLR